MSFIDVHFFVFIIIFLIIYYIVPKKYRYIPILIGSYLFYGFAEPKFLLYLIYSTVVTYLGGYAVSRRRSRPVLALFLSLNIGALIIAKYNAFFPVNLGIILPIGMSFFVFQSTTYIIDIYRGRIELEKNFLQYASFVAFFPTILSGPIQKSRELLPQIKNPKGFSDDDMKKGTILFIWGCFEKLMISNRLYVIIDNIYSDNSVFTAPYYILAMLCFSLYIYADFSSYSDMARGVAKMMGIDVGKNFLNPYLSLSLSEFWNRWHTSLNSWFLENLYIPLGGNRKGALRKYINTMLVFLVSGIWHGALIHFVVWGGVNGALVVVENILTPFRKSVYTRLKIDESFESIVFLKRLKVYIILSITWLFFGTGLRQSINILETICMGHFIDYFDEGLLLVSGSSATTFLTIIFTLLFVVVQCKRTNEALYYVRFEKQPLPFQALLMATIVVLCIFGAFSSLATVNTEFLYFNF